MALVAIQVASAPFASRPLADGRRGDGLPRLAELGGQTLEADFQGERLAIGHEDAERADGGAVDLKEVGHEVLPRKRQSILRAAGAGRNDSFLAVS
jgi:hypothetical protein